MTTSTNTNEMEWLVSAKRALGWLIEVMTPSEWHRRRKGVAEYFHSVKRKLEEGVAFGRTLEKNGYSPLAVYDDWIAWYMYLIESMFERVGNDEPWQSNRIAPFFSLVGKYVDAVKKMPGIDERVKSMLSEKSNKPDDTLYELAVAVLYHRNGWHVRFLPERGGSKTPDMEVSRDGKKFWVECKRFAKVTDYAEKERQEWQKRWLHLVNAMKIIGIPAFVDVVFKVPLEEVEEEAVAGAYWGYMKFGKIKLGETFRHEKLDITVRKLDLDKINKILETSPTRPSSPLMIKILTGEYDMHGSYTQGLTPSGIQLLEPENELYALNEFYAGIREGYIAKWDCVSERSLDRKFRDIRKRLSDAVSQIPIEGEGIIHIGYETVSGPSVELKRHRKIQETISSFDFSNKGIAAIYCNALQLLSKVDGFDWAETIIYFEKYQEPLLDDRLLLDLPGPQGRDTTHWEEDLKFSTK